MAEKPGQDEGHQGDDAATIAEQKAPCPVCGEPRGDASPCPHCGMR